MKTTTIQLIKEELLSKEKGVPLLTVCKISRLFINKDLIHFFNRLLSESTDANERLIILLKLKKAIIQTPREPDQTQLEAQPAEFAQFRLEIEKEQAFYDPIKWINAEIDYLNSIKNLTDKEAKASNINIENKEWLNREEMLQTFKISKSTLNRRIADGMPVVKMGARQQFNRQKVNAWLNNIN